MKFFYKGKNIEPESEKICVLYDPKDGRIAHTHEVITLPGGRKVDDEEVEARAFKRAAALGKDTSKFKALHVKAPKDHDRSSMYRVDPNSLTLTKLRRPEKG